MQGQMPQEIEVWFILPAIRRELAKTMIDYFHLTQKEVAEKMFITESAVSQYLNSKRAKEVIFSNAVLEQIKASAKKIISDNKTLVPEIVKLCNLTAVRQIMCDIHKKQDIILPHDCDVCFHDLLKLKTR